MPNNFLTDGEKYTNNHTANSLAQGQTTANAGTILACLINDPNHFVPTECLAPNQKHLRIKAGFRGDRVDLQSSSGDRFYNIKLDIIEGLNQGLHKDQLMSIDLHGTDPSSLQQINGYHGTSSFSARPLPHSKRVRVTPDPTNPQNIKGEKTCNPGEFRTNTPVAKQWDDYKNLRQSDTSIGLSDSHNDMVPDSHPKSPTPVIIVRDGAIIIQTAKGDGIKIDNSGTHILGKFHYIDDSPKAQAPYVGIKGSENKMRNTVPPSVITPFPKRMPNLSSDGVLSMISKAAVFAKLAKSISKIV